MVVRRPVLVSPGGHQAFAEILSNGHARGECTNTLKLFVKRLHESEFRIAYVQVPRESEDLKGINIVDWSPDNRFLLAELVIGQWGSDFGGRVPILYNSQTGTVTPEDWLDSALKSYFDNRCSLDPAIEGLGFISSGGLIIRIKPARDMIQGGIEPDSCFKAPELLLLNPVTNRIAVFAGKHKIEKYGRLLK